MTLTICHFSDLHGNANKLFAVQDKHADVYVCSGDFFPNASRGDAEVEAPFQREWLHAPQPKGSVIDRMVALIGTAPFLWVGGNHDYIDLADELRAQGVNAHTITPEGVRVCGLTFAGFREIPYITGEWAGEAQQDTLRHLVYQTMQNGNPDVLVTHAPPAGIMDRDRGCGHGFGIQAITSALAYTEHQVRMHLFGHIHASQGTENIMGVQFCNGAGTVQFHQLG